MAGHKYGPVYLLLACLSNMVVRELRPCHPWRHLNDVVSIWRPLAVLASVLLPLFAGAETAAGWASLNPAGLSADWDYRGDLLGVLRVPGKAIATHPVYRLQHPKKGYLLTAAEPELAAYKQGGFQLQGIAFHAPTAVGQPVYRFLDGVTTSYGYSLSYEQALERGTTIPVPAFRVLVQPVDALHRDRTSWVALASYVHRKSGVSLLVAGKESPYVVGAYYFGAYSASSIAQINGTKKVYGRSNDWWGGVEDFYGREPGVARNVRDWAGDFSNLKPAIGYYDQKSVETLQKHIRQASDAGLSFFSFYWYWSHKRNSELLPEALQSFLSANTEGRMKFNISFYAHPWNDDMAIDATNVDAVVDRIVTYFGNPNYLRLPDGRPVFVMGDHRNIRGTDGKKCEELKCYLRSVDRFLAILKQRSNEKLGIVPFVQVQVGALGWSASREIDGITCLIPPLQVAGGSPYPQFDASVFTQLANSGKPVSPCMLQNFDERPRQDILVSDRKAIRYLVGKTDGALRHNLEVTRQFSDAAYATGHHPASRIIYLYAWNEWHEGGVLEPNATSGAHDLNIVTDLFRLPRSPSSCLDEGKCQ